jgi:hypothetical protein
LVGIEPPPANPNRASCRKPAIGRQTRKYNPDAGAVSVNLDSNGKYFVCIAAIVAQQQARFWCCRRQLILLPAADDERHDCRAKDFGASARTDQRHCDDRAGRNGCGADCRANAQRQSRSTSLVADLNRLRHFHGIKLHLPLQLARG